MRAHTSRFRKRLARGSPSLLTAVAALTVTAAPVENAVDAVGSATLRRRMTRRRERALLRAPPTHNGKTGFVIGVFLPVSWKDVTGALSAPLATALWRARQAVTPMQEKRTRTREQRSGDARVGRHCANGPRHGDRRRRRRYRVLCSHRLLLQQSLLLRELLNLLLLLLLQLLQLRLLLPLLLLLLQLLQLLLLLKL